MMRLLYFIFLIPLNWFSFHWLWKAALKSAGVTKEEVWQYRTKVGHQPRPHKYVMPWLLQQSADPQQTKKLLVIYQLFGTLPLLLCFNFAVIGCFTHVFDPFLRYAEVIMPIIIVIAAIAGALYHKRLPKRGCADIQEKRDSFGDLKDFIRFYKNDIRTKINYKEKDPKERTKYIAKGIVSLVMVIGVLIGIILLLINLGTPKTPVTADQVWDVLLSRDWQPYDRTEACREAWNAETAMEKAIVMEQGDIRFDFYVLNTDQNALSLQQQYASYIRQNKYSLPNVEYEETMANYTIYTLKANGIYTVLVRVDHTVVYAYCKEENAGTIVEIMTAIGYFEK